MTDHVDEALPAAADRARRLFLYLSELASIRSKTTRDISDYDTVAWFNELPEGAGWSVFDEGIESAGDAWIQVERVDLPPWPTPPEAVVPFLRTSNLRNTDVAEPGLLEVQPGAEPSDDVLEAYLKYVEQDWLPWRDKYTALKSASDFYQKLFSMSERSRRLGEVYEVVIGLGLLAWKGENQPIRRHLITSPADIIVDENTGAVSVIPKDTQGRNEFELDMLEVRDRGPADMIGALSEQIADSEPLDLATAATSLLTRWMNQSHAQGTVTESLTPAPGGFAPMVALAPAMILRRRGQRSLSRLLKDIARQIEEDGVFPEGVERLVSTGSPTKGDELPSFPDPEVYFPLLSNTEQLQIVERLKTDRGVLVQGPPGTGKSHTIANLVSHLLAHGKRVLVTSHTEHALEVLHGMLPEEIKPLCISVLGNDRQSIRALEGAVSEISSRQADWSMHESEELVRSLRADLGRLRSDRASKQVDLREVLESESRAVDVGSFRGTQQQVAAELASLRDELGWLPIDPTSQTPPFSDQDFVEFGLLTRTLSMDAAVAADAGLPMVSDLLTADEFSRLVDSERRAERAFEEAQSVHGDWLGAVTSGSAKTLETAEKELVGLANSLQGFNVGWESSARNDVMGGDAAVWRALHGEANSLQEVATDALEHLGATRIEVKLDGSVEELENLVGGLLDATKEGARVGPRLGLTSSSRRERELIRSSRVNGAVPRTRPEIALVLESLKLDRSLQYLRQVWRRHLNGDEAATPAQEVARFGHHLEALRAVLALPLHLEKVQDAVASIDGVSVSDWNDPTELKRVAIGLHSVRVYLEIAAVKQKLLEIKSAAGDGVHPVQVRLRASIEERNDDAYRAALVDLSEARALADLELRRRGLVDRLGVSAPSFQELVSSSEEIPNERLQEAWSWAVADRKLSELIEPDRPRALRRSLDQLELLERGRLAELAAAQAWRRMFESLSDEHSQSLKAWSVAVRKIGKGTGKYAEQHRRTARSYMAQAREAIPAWVMPMYRVAESFAAQPGVFDVVIVDEASQSGVESLFLFHLAKQVVVVGDDQQIAPEGVGINQEEVMALEQQMISDLPFSELLEPTNSLFDQANVRFRSAIVLREHFRCMPEIIEFSNRIAYPNRKLIPLRQFGSDRLDPIKTVYLKHGYREGGRSAINRPEANEIVARIRDLCSSPAYRDCSIGVISLQGTTQAQLIERMLLEQIGPTVMLERQIVCGDAYAFQGDERDVIFMSMVAAPNERIGALSREPDKRRFNVAASRAKDQVWLVHSVRPDDLGVTDMRRELLQYYMEPEIEHLEEIAARDWTDLQTDLFDSKFEQDVYLVLRERGFRVAPQVQVAGYRIDLVVEGARGRLAVECDGDRWHGADRHDADTARQRQLERCGWRFVRIIGSEFYRDQMRALDELWRTLDLLGIEPGGYSAFDKWQIAEEPLTSAEEPFGDPTRANPLIRHSRSESERDGPEPEAPTRSPDPARHTVGTPEELASHDERPSIQHPPERTSPAASQHPGTGADALPSVQEVPDDIPTERAQGPRPVAAVAPRRADESPALPTTEATPSRGPERPKSAVPGPAGARLAPYVDFEGSTKRPLSATQEAIRDGIIEIVAAEGPVLGGRILQVYNKASGGSRLGGDIRRAINSALTSAVRKGMIFVDDPLGTPGNKSKTFRLAYQPKVAERELGPRTIHEVPPAELAARIQRQRAQQRDQETCFRAILDEYGLTRLTPAANDTLDQAWRLTDRR